MDFNSTLYNIDSELTQEDLESLRFLCVGLLPTKKLLAIKSNLDLFQELQKSSLLEKDKYDILAELLYIIGQHSLLKYLRTSKWGVQEALKKKRNVSLYRHMLYQLYEDITAEDLRCIVFLLSIPKKYDENRMKFFDVVYYLEKNDKLAEDNLDVLENAISHVSQELVRKINDYKKTREIQKSRPESVSSEDENDNKTPLSIQAQDAEREDSGMQSIGELVQHVSETVNEKDLLNENTESRMSDLSLNEQPKTEMYSMNGKHRGFCLIINNSEFLYNKPRPGTEKDVEFLTNVFTWLGLDVVIYSELLKQDIDARLTEFSRRDHTERDCFVCCILTHGESQAVYGTDDISIPIKEVVSCFSMENCLTLAGKPKLFFIQACQGRKSQGAHAIEADAVSSVDEWRTTISIPNDADVLIGMSTVDGYYSFRDPQKGTWYIQALCENLTKMVPNGEDILSILTKVNKDVSEMEHSKQGKTNKQMPQPAYTLRKKLVFPRPHSPYKPPFQKTN